MEIEFPRRRLPSDPINDHLRARRKVGDLGNRQLILLEPAPGAHCAGRRRAWVDRVFVVDGAVKFFRGLLGQELQVRDRQFLVILVLRDAADWNVDMAGPL